MMQQESQISQRNEGTQIRIVCRIKPAKAAVGASSQPGSNRVKASGYESGRSSSRERPFTSAIKTTFPVQSPMVNGRKSRKASADSTDSDNRRSSQKI